MFLPILQIIIDLLNQAQWRPPWDTGIPPEELFSGPSIVLWVLAWVFLSIGAVVLTILIIYTKYGREISIKLSVITIITASTFLGFSFHFFLLQAGFIIAKKRI